MYEEYRQEFLENLEQSEAEVRKQYAPGSFDCHEALHMASAMLKSVDRELLQHGAIITHPEWFALAEEAFDRLYALYQAIGEEHVGRKAK
jgi:hypothetical protein